MNKTIKVALCISLAGIGVFVWTHSASAGKPARAPVVVTFISGDVQAEPFELPGPFVAIIDFASFVPYVCSNTLDPEVGKAILNMLEAKNPITYSSLKLKLTGSLSRIRLDFTTKIDDDTYMISMLAFASGGKTSTSPDTYEFAEGGFAVYKNGKAALTAGWCVGGVSQADVEFTITK